jgi:glutamyl-tRNA reductase
MYRHDTGKAERHLLRVITGQDSLIAGETQIIGQVARAYAAAQRAGTAGPALSLLFESAIRASRRTRASAGQARGAASASSRAVERAAGLAGPLPAARVLVIGTGETGRLLVQALRQHGVGRVDVMTRSQARAAELSRRWGTEVHTTAHLPALLAASDLVMCSTSSSVPLVTEAMARAAVSRRPTRPLLFVDISVPRTVEKSAGLVQGVTLLDIDSLKMPGPAADDPAVTAVIGEELAALELRMAEMALRPVIGGMWRKADSFRAEVLERTRARVPELDDKAWAHIENLARALVAKILHDPATRLRAEAGNGHAREYAEALRHLFALPDRPGQP